MRVVGSCEAGESRRFVAWVLGGVEDEMSIFTSAIYTRV